jgi:hypothetical protein
MGDGEAPAPYERNLFPWLDPKVQGRQHERRRANKRGARLQPASGSRPGRKEDSRDGVFLEQTKWTRKDAFPISSTRWLEIRRNAEAEGRSPQLAITFSGANPDGTDLTIVVREQGDFD